MRATRFGSYIFACIATVVLFIAGAAQAGTYTVTNTNDSGAGSLRQGVLDANTGTCTSPCTITFQTPLFATTQTINTASSLTITANNVFIDGFSGGTTGTANTNAMYSADNSVQNVVINGPSTTCCAVISISGTGVKIQGLVIQDGLQGIDVTASGSVTVTGCKIGTNNTGTGAVPNVTGIRVFGTSPTATIGGTGPADRNLISGNSGAGISVQSSNNTILGNYIGTNAAGTAAVANGTGVTSAGSNNNIGSIALGNLISGNTNRGVEITGGTNTTVRFSRIGTNGAGTIAVPNNAGVFVGSGVPSNLVIGGSGSGNIISGNTGHGIEIAGGNGFNFITGNAIGVGITGTSAVANGGHGVYLNGAGNSNTISGPGQMIGGNGGSGITINGANNTNIQTNNIGYFGGTPVGNTGNGILVTAATGTTSISGNVIRSNGSDGVDVDGAIIGVQVLQNEIANNSALGIDLHASAIDGGATPNDAGDPDSGTGNHSQNFPVTAAAYLNGATLSSNLTVKFSVDSSTVSTTNSMRVEAFEADPDVTNPEGLRYLNGACYAGNVITNQVLTATSAGLLPGGKIVLTATSYTDGSCAAVNEGTSEFSPGVTVGVQPGVVVNTNDSGTGSLRQAITDANGGACTAPCTITFNIPTSDPNYGGNVFTIRPLSQLPSILTSNTILDGATQTAATGNTNLSGPEIVINGSLAPVNTAGLWVDSFATPQGQNIEIRSVVVNGFPGYGIVLSSATFPVIGTKILGSYIGTDPTGTTAMPNTGYGIFMQNTVTNTQIGAAGNGNIISGNGVDGVYVFHNTVTGTVFLGNGIGTNAAKTAGIPNGGNGIFGVPANSTIGGQAAGEPNTIAFNTGDGIYLVGSGGVQNAIRFNSIHSNGELGIDLGANGVAINDAGDADTGANDLQNHPVLTSIAYNSGPNTTAVSGQLLSLPNTTFDIDWYSNTTLDGTGHGEGETYEGTSTWTTDGTGFANISISLPGNKRAANIVATASRVAGPVRETSEFSQPAPNAAPVAVNDAPSTAEDTPVTFDPRANDTDANGDPITITAATNNTAGSGSIVCSATSCTFTPAPNFNGPVNITYTVADAFGGSGNGTIGLTITAVPDPPVAVNDALVTSEDTPNSVNVLANDTDSDTPAASLTVSGFTNGTIGTVSCTAAGLCTYTPNANQNGIDSFTYTVTDGTTPVTGTVNVTVNAVADPPVANNDTLTVPEDAVNSLNVLANDTDVDTPAGSLTVNAFTQGAKGSVTCSPGGICTYTAALNQTGPDSFTYTVTDGTTPQTATVNVTITPVDDPPVANPDVLATNEDTPNSVNVLANDTDVDTPAGSLQVTGFTNGTKGTVSCTAAGICTYTPNANQVGGDSFTYTVTDGTTPVNGVVNVTIAGINDPPVAVNDVLVTNEDTPNSVNVLANDVDPDSTPTISSFTNGSKGTVVCTGATCTYHPSANLNGSDSFTYTITDGTSFSTATVNVTINAINDPPVANPDSASTLGGNPVSINVLANDTDPENDALTFFSNTAPSSGSVSCTGGVCTYTPNTGFSGTDTFTYVVKDSNGATATGTVTITVNGCPTDTPVQLSPINGRTGVSRNGRLLWTNVGAASYSIYLGPANANGCTQPFASSPTNSLDYNDLQPNTTYAWRVEAFSPGCDILSSSCSTFTTVSNCNVAITLVKPLSGQVSSPIEFEWLPVANATGYTVFAQVGGSGFNQVGVTTATKLTATLPTDGTVQWYVVANVTGCGNVQSQTASFNLCNRPSAPIARVVGQATSGQNYRVEWDAVPNAVRYEVQQADNPEFTGATTESTTQTFANFRHEVTTQARALHYRVRAFTNCTPNGSDYSLPIRIVIIPLPAKENPNPSANVPAGSGQVVVQQVFVPGEPNVTLFFTAVADRPWLTVTPPNGTIPPEGITLTVTADSKNLPNGTFTATVIVTITNPLTNVGGIATNGTTTKSVPVSVSLVTPVTPVSNRIEPSGDTLIIPSVGHLDGVNSHWQSDIRVTNVGTQNAKYALTFTPAPGSSQGTKQTTIDVAGGATTALDDIIKNWFGVGSLGDSANGMLEIRSADSQPLTAVASSRTYNVTANGTLGQYIPALPFGGFIGKAAQGSLKQTLSIQQVAQSSAYRTNVGVVEASGQAANVMLSVYNAAGTKLIDIPVNLAGGEQKQLNALLAQNGITNLADGRIEVNVLDGAGKVTAYASVVDNATNDPLLVAGTPITTTNNSNKWVLPGVADLANSLANWRTDMRVFNAGLSSQAATLTLHTPNAAPLTQSVSLQPGQVRNLDDVVKSLFGASNIGGAVHVSTANSANLVVTGRTYNLTSNGTFGQFIPAVTPNDAVGANGKTLHILQVEDSTRYRTNLGLAEVSGQPVTLEVQIVLPDTLATPTLTIPMAANEFRQLGIIRDLALGNVYNARITVKVIEGSGRVTAYGSVVDMTTQDPTYVPAQQ